MSKQTLYSLVILIIFIIAVVFIGIYYKKSSNTVNENNTPVNTQTTPVNTSASINSNIDYIGDTSTDYESNGDIQSGFKSIDGDINTL